MARYIDADKLLTDEKTHTLPVGCGKASGNVVVFVDDIEKMSTADVVPKSEVEELKADLEVWKQNRFNIYQSLELYKMTRQEVAREIFEEIENEINNELQNNHKVLPQVKFSNELWNRISGRINAFQGIYDFIAELKKKYTEGESNGSKQ